MLAITGMGIFSFEMNDAYTFTDRLQQSIEEHAEENQHLQDHMSADDDYG